MIPQSRLDEIKARLYAARDWLQPAGPRSLSGSESHRLFSALQSGIDLLAEIERLQRIETRLDAVKKILSVSSDDEADRRDKGGAIDAALNVLRGGA